MLARDGCPSIWCDGTRRLCRCPDADCDHKLSTQPCFLACFLATSTIAIHAARSSCDRARKLLSPNASGSPFVTSSGCWGSVSGSPAAWPGNTAPPNGTNPQRRHRRIRTSPCGPGYANMPRIIPAVDSGPPITTPEAGAGVSIIRRSNDSGAKKGCGCRSDGATNATAHRRLPSRWPRMHPTGCGRSTSSSPSPPTCGRSRSYPSSTNTRGCLGGLVERSITGEDLIVELDRLAVDRGTYPAVLRCSV